MTATSTLDWPQWPAVESVPDRRSGAWVFQPTYLTNWEPSEASTRPAQARTRCQFVCSAT
jgi:hypothetical protein